MRTISIERLTSELAERPGLTPIGINASRGLLVWCDVGDHRFTEPVFSDFLDWLGNQPGRYPLFACELVALVDLDLPDNCLEPAGFVFHTGRCGSTLFSRALAQSPHHIVMSEARPHNNIWAHFTKNWRKPDAIQDEHLAQFAKLIRLMGRKRDDTQQAYFVKFSSWQILLRGHVRKVFPQVPCVFLYRDPAQVLASLSNAGPGWLAGKNTAFGAFCADLEIAEACDMDALSYMKQYLINLMKAALNADDREMTYLNYRELKADRFQRILKSAFDYTPRADALEPMQAQFGVYSKDVAGKQAFEGDEVDKEKSPTPEIEAHAGGRLAELYRQLEIRGWTP